MNLSGQDLDDEGREVIARLGDHGLGQVQIAPWVHAEHVDVPVGVAHTLSPDHARAIRPQFLEPENSKAIIFGRNPFR